MTAMDALLVVDLQHDFLPGGALGVNDGDAILEPICALMTGGRFPVVVATQDWHPAGHISFASSHPGRAAFDVVMLYDRPQTLWPDHCVQGSHGAELHPTVPQGPVTAVFRKGTDPKVDSYSAFRHNWDATGRRPSTGLAGYLSELGVESLWIAGLARDYCVLWSAEDAVDAGFEVHVLWDLTRPVDPSSDTEVRSALAASRVTID